VPVMIMEHELNGVIQSKHIFHADFRMVQPTFRCVRNDLRLGSDT
jgi:hypothetical protein